MGPRNGIHGGGILRDPGDTQRRPSLTTQGEGPFGANPVDETQDFNPPDQLQSGFSFYERIHSRILLKSQLSLCI